MESVRYSSVGLGGEGVGGHKRNRLGTQQLVRRTILLLTGAWSEKHKNGGMGALGMHKMDVPLTIFFETIAG